MAKTAELLKDEPAVRLIERVDQRQLGALPDQVGVHPAARMSADRPDARRKLHAFESFRLTRAAKGCFHSRKGGLQLGWASSPLSPPGSTKNTAGIGFRSWWAYSPSRSSGSGSVGRTSTTRGSSNRHRRRHQT